MRISMLRLPRERSSQDLVPPAERDIIRVHRMYYNRCSKGKKIFEYLVDKSRWITKDKLRISLSPILVIELKVSSPHPISQAQREVLLSHSVTPIRDEHGYTSRASRSSSASADPVLEGEPITRKRGHQNAYTEISSDTYHSTNTDDNHNAYNTSDKDPRSAK
ncbi:hypothetical protein NA56DRAFT_333807 [Hyaloscypha hepaticicola]|uniref:Uncharacterized protein n=1 Tax=Hyaloscypha hepaticicola TaxID=2082293 RepID=A0A2J6PNT6_9HELO|nr:hypothetical protein NA56DRAFT_333807 [Hyaloscypha hepaticicola]